MLAVIVSTRVSGQSEAARVTATKVQIKNFQQALELFHLNNGFFPTTEQGLKALVEKPTMRPEPMNYQRGGYLNAKSVPKDPWGNDFIYICPGERGDYDIISLGADGRESGTDNAADITNWD
jgi:general secretion pathway protein G